MNEKHATAFRTDNYAIFKRLGGNRAVTTTRINKVRNSILENGYIYNPIICNEKREVIDGQARLHVLEAMGLPVDYIIEPGLTVEDCKVLNLYTTKWSTLDFIDSYAEQGNVSYKYLRNLVVQFKGFSIGTICIACSTSGLASGGVGGIKTVQSGLLEIDPDSYELAIRTLTMLRELKPMIDNDRGKANYMYSAIIFALQRSSADQTRRMNRTKAKKAEKRAEASRKLA